MVVVVILLAIQAATPQAVTWGAVPSEAETLYAAGRYDECIALARDHFERGVWNEKWPQILIQGLLTTGQYEQAERVYEAALERYANRIALRLLGHEVYRYVGRPDQAEQELGVIYEMVRSSPWRFSSSEDQVVLGRFFAIQGEDSRKILELVYDRVRSRSPALVSVYIATAELALDKHDYPLAAQQLETAAKLAPLDPQIPYLQSKAWKESDSQKASRALQTALELNPLHLPSLLAQVDYLIDAEQYDEAEEMLTKVLSVNLRHPEAWAYHAVIAHLKGHFQGELALRDVALGTWPTNYEVDHLIGRKLSQKYRFREGAEYQRRALASRAQYLPAQFQLAQDLLRLGETEAGWKLAAEVQNRDGYNVVSYNLMTLKDQLDRYSTLEDAEFIVRMDASEAVIYGPEVLQLLHQARDVLCEKYEYQLTEPVHVEIFARQQDFAIRTFGLPGGAGYLGVCFGSLITANSPASQGTHPSNWQAVLWHEFCHVVTLQKTNNRMPRWLSEGISVYEERQRDPAWGQRMSPDYRQRIMSGADVPVSQLSSAFLRPSSPQDLQYAYFQSSLVVEFLMETYGLETLQRVLVDLSVGMPIEESLTRYIGPSDYVDQQFREYARNQAESLGARLDWTPPVRDGDDPSAESTSEDELPPNNYWLLKSKASELINQQQWEEAIPLLETLQQGFPEDPSPDSAHYQLVRVHRQQGDRAAERQVLEQITRLNADATSVYDRLMEIAATEEDWHALRTHAQQFLAVNPIIPRGHEALARAARALDQPELLVRAQEAILQLSPTDPAKAHLELAEGYLKIGDRQAARKNVLQALEYAPRYRDALQLLMTVREERSTE